jgi:hypothetical protein
MRTESIPAQAKLGRATTACTGCPLSKLPLIYKNRQRYQRSRDDPQDNIFAAAAFFFCHKRRYSIPEIALQVPMNESTTNPTRQHLPYGFVAAMPVPVFL